DRSKQRSRPNVKARCSYNSRTQIKDAKEVAAWRYFRKRNASSKLLAGCSRRSRHLDNSKQKHKTKDETNSN
ncbi:unnamed protein product, partial [Amoebophrya sp. A25]